MFYTSKNCQITLNNLNLVVSDLSLSLQTDLNPVYIAENRHSFYYSPQNGIGGNLSIDYYLTGTDYVKDFFYSDARPITGLIGGMVMKSGYLKSYSFTAEPNKPIPVKAEFVFFDSLTGTFNPTHFKAAPRFPIQVSDCKISDLLNGSNGHLSGMTSLNYQYNVNIEPIYRADELTPYRIAFKEKEIVANIEYETISGILPISGYRAGLEFVLSRPNFDPNNYFINDPGVVGVYRVSGVVSQRSTETSNKNLIKNNITIRQNYLGEMPVLLPYPAPADTTPFTKVHISYLPGQAAPGAYMEIGFEPPSDPNAEQRPVLNFQDIIDGERSPIERYTSVPIVWNPNENLGGITVPPAGEENPTVIGDGGSSFRPPPEPSFSMPAENITALGTTGLRFQIPSGVPSNAQIILNTNFGLIQITGNFPIVQPPLNVTTLIPTTGLIGGTATISGANFFGVSNVYFGGAISPSFSVVSPSIIKAQIPSSGYWDFVKVYSTNRNLTGTSPMKFVPVPIVQGFSPFTGFAGTSVTITGLSFSGTNQVTFNNLLSPSFTVNTNFSITATVPSGNTFGYIRLSGQSGVTARSTTEFRPLVSLTSISPSSAITGGALQLVGTNFFTELMYPADAGNSHFIADIGGGTGMFYRVSTTSLTGLVPANANSGKVYIYDRNFSPYPSNVTFTLLYGQPFISGVIPGSGKFNSTIQVKGTNLFQTTGIRLKNAWDDVTVTGAVSSFGDTFSFIVPTLVGGPYGVTLYTSHGTATGAANTSQGFYALKPPTISGFSPASGGVGTIIDLSGLNFYPQSFTYFNHSGVGTEIVSGASGVSNNSYDKLRFRIPVGMTGGAVNTLFINNSAGVASASVLFNLIPSPQISGFFRISGEWGDVITTSGAGLNLTTGVYIGNQIVSGFTGVGTASFIFSIPTGTQSDYLYAYTRGGYARSSGVLSVLIPSIATGAITISPTSIRWGKTLTVSAPSLYTATEILFSGYSSQQSGLYTVSVTGFSKVGQTGIYVTVPRNVASGPLAIKGPRGLAQSPNLSIIPDPIINIISTNYGVYNQRVDVSGSNFTGMRFYFLSQNTGLWSGLVDADNQVVSGASGASFYVPKNIRSGPIIISGDGNYYVGWTGTFVPLPTISGFRITGSTTGTLITLTGYNASEVNSLLFVTGNGFSGAAELTYVAYLSGNHSQITGAGILNPTTGCSIWSGVINTNYGGFGRPLLVSNQFTGVSDGPTFKLLDAAQYIPQTQAATQYFFNWAAPYISGFISPVRGNTSTQVTISGYNFRTITGVYINNNLGTITQKINGGLDVVKFTPPASLTNTSGRVTGVSIFGTTISSDYFTYIDAPVLSGFTPKRGTMAMPVKITGFDLKYATGVYFGDFSASFATGIEGEGNYIVTGYVPDVTYSLPRTMNVGVYNEAGVGQYQGFTVYSSGSTIKYRTSTANLYSIPATNGVLSIPHEIGFIPDAAQIVLVNRSPEYGYSVDDEVNMAETTTKSVFGAEPYSISRDSVNVNLVHNFGDYPIIEIFNKSNGQIVTGGLTNSSWRIRAIATYQFE